MASKKAGIIAGLAVAGVATVGMLASSAAAFADPSAPPSPGAAASAPANGAPSGKAARGQDGQAGQSGQAGRPDRGGQRAAVLYTLIQTARLNDVDPQAWLADVLARIAAHPVQQLGDLLPWNWRKSGDVLSQAA